MRLRLRTYRPFQGRLGPSAAFPLRFVSVLMSAGQDADVAHLHSLWLYPTLVGSRVLKRTRVPYVVSPHGSLMPMALRQKSLKKTIVLELWERASLDGAAALIAASESEAAALKSQPAPIR